MENYDGELAAQAALITGAVSSFGRVATLHLAAAGFHIGVLNQFLPESRDTLAGIATRRKKTAAFYLLCLP